MLDAIPRICRGVLSLSAAAPPRGVTGQGVRRKSGGLRKFHCLLQRSSLRLWNAPPARRFLRTDRAFLARGLLRCSASRLRCSQMVSAQMATFVTNSVASLGSPAEQMIYALWQIFSVTSCRFLDYRKHLRARERGIQIPSSRDPVFVGVHKQSYLKFAGMLVAVDHHIGRTCPRAT